MIFQRLIIREEHGLQGVPKEIAYENRDVAEY
jgi:hypothetical protein